MKITAGMGSVEDYEMLVQAGADEIFCGYVPFDWNQKFGNLMPLNRREVMYYHVQVNVCEDMKLLANMMKDMHVPVAITLNALYYTEEQLKWIGDTILRLMELGFRDYIIADIGLVLYLRERRIPCYIHMSGEIGEWNEPAIRMIREICGQDAGSPQCKRIIFHRKNSIEDMESMIGAFEEKDMEYEAFLMNEMCHFTGGFCNSLHCDEMGYLCRVSYWLGTVRNGDAVPEKIMALQEQAWDQEPDLKAYDESGYLCGETGCGLCALYQLKQAGITHLKLVGRGNYVDHMEKDIRNLRTALDILEMAENEEKFQCTIKRTMFPNGCSGKCYYR